MAARYPRVPSKLAIASLSYIASTMVGGSAPLTNRQLSISAAVR